MLEYVDGITKISGFPVIDMQEKENNLDESIFIDKIDNSVLFRFQNDEKNGCPLRAMIGLAVEVVYAKGSVYLDSKDEEGIKLKAKHQAALNNLLLSFKHLKEIEENVSISNVSPKKHIGTDSTRH